LAPKEKQIKIDKKIMFFYIFTCFFIFFFLMKFLGALPQAPSAVCRNKAFTFIPN